MTGDTIQFDLSAPIPLSQFCIKAETVGSNVETHIFDVEVCGAETISYSSNKDLITKVYKKSDIPAEIDLTQEGFTFQSSI